MKKYVLSLCLFFLSIGCYAQNTGESVEKWGRFEKILKGTRSGNPFSEISLTAEFSNGTQTIKANGFYDGDGVYKIRFMPVETGTWKYVTTSNSKELNNIKGEFICVNPGKDNHGMVKVWNTYNFKYTDGKIYYPFGTTMYAWTHQGEKLQEETLFALKTSGFNKLRMCVFPKYYTNVENDPELYPYQKLSQKKDSTGRVTFSWNFKKFDPAFFAHLEKQLDELRDIGIEADLIIFHPYDKGRWGFDDMGKENDEFYLKYLVARLASFRNVWWSMANEFDYIKTKPREIWDNYSKVVSDNDPYKHLLSIHNGSIYFDNSKPFITHLSIQNSSAVGDFGRAGLLRDAFFKPVIYDEVCYEGNLTQRWGRLSGQEMVHAVWQGVIAGTYVTHGETIKGVGDTISWAKGGKFKGESPARIAFLRNLIEQGPGPLTLADNWKDLQTAQVDSNYYMIYFGKEVLTEWKFSLPKKNGPPKGTKFKIDVIDTWNMTVTPLTDSIVTAAADGYRIFDKDLKVINLPGRPFIALRIKRL